MLCARKLATATLLLATSVYSADFLPLRPGNTWTYRENKTGQTFAIQVGTPVLLKDRTYYSLNGYVDRQVFVRIDESGQLVSVDDQTGHESILTPFAPFEQGWWEAPFRPCDQMSQALEKRGVHDGPAGPFENVLEVRYRNVSCADTGIEAEQYAENIGMVRRVVSSIAGPRTFELIYARAGNLAVDASAIGTFSVSADLTSSLEQIPVTLRLHSNPGALLKLSFPTAQEYELTLLDPNGKTAWRWSDGQVFTQAEHDLKVYGDWNKQLYLPRAALSGQTTSGAPYVLQAWLTTAGEAPRFAAALPILLPVTLARQSAPPRHR